MDVFSLVMRLKEEGAAQVKASIDKLNQSLDDSARKAGVVDEAIGELKNAFRDLATLAAAGTFFNKLIDETSAAQFAQAQLKAALKSTGNVAGQTVDELNAMAGALQETTVFADDAVTASQSLLLTFTKVQGDIFPRATKAIADVAQAMGTDLQSATIQVGKALNDPIQGVTALTRSGIQFSDAQKEMIKSLVETNQLAEAQKIVLAELETQFGGSAEAAGSTLGGAIARLGNAFGDLFEISESASEGVVGAIEFIISALNGLNSVLTSTRRAIQLFALNAGVIFEQIKAWFTMSGDEYRGYMKILQAYESEQESLILGVISEEREKRKLAKTNRELAASQGEMAALKPVKFDIERMMGQSTSMPVQATIGPSLIVPNFTDKLKAEMTKGATDWLAASAKAYEERINELAMRIKFAVGDTLGNALADGIQAAIEQKSIGAGFKALTETLLRGLGDMMIQFGKASLVASTIMDTIFKALAKALPGGAIVASLAMIAAGAALKGAAGAAFGGGGRATQGMTMPAMGSAMTGGAMGLPTQFYGPTAAGSASTIERINPVSVTIIGPNDPAAQRQMQELVRNAQRRGSV